MFVGQDDNGLGLEVGNFGLEMNQRCYIYFFGSRGYWGVEVRLQGLF